MGHSVLKCHNKHVNEKHFINHKISIANTLNKQEGKQEAQ